MRTAARFAMWAVMAVVFLPVCSVDGGIVVDMATPVSDVDRNVRAVAVHRGRASLMYAATGWQLQLRDPISTEDRHSDAMGHALAAQLAADVTGVWLDTTVAGVDWELIAPRPDRSDVTGLSSTGAAFAEWLLVSLRRCLVEPVAFSLTAMSMSLEPVGAIDTKAAAVADAGITTLVVSSDQQFLSVVDVDVVRVRTADELAGWILLNSGRC